MNYRLQTYVGTMMGIQGGTSVGQESVEPIVWAPSVDSGFEILIEDGQDRGKTIVLDTAFMLIGREEFSGEKRHGWLLFSDRSVSRRQALLWWDVKEQAFHLVHVDSATNPTLVDHHPVQTTLLKSGQHVKMGHLGFRIHRRPLVRPNSSFIRTAMQLLGDYQDTEHWVNTRGLALTIVEGEGQGQTFILNKNYHLLSARNKGRSGSLGGALCLPDSVLSPEQAALIWVESARSYAIVHQRVAAVPTWISHASTDPRTFPDPYEDPVVVNPEAPLYVHPGDIIGVSHLKVLMHQEVAEILEACVVGVLRGDWPTWACGFPTSQEPVQEEPQNLDFAPANPETVRWTPTAEWFVQVAQGAQQYPEIPIMSTTLTPGRVFTMGGPGRRANDILLDDPNLPDTMARIEFQGNGTWTIVPEVAGTMYVGGRPLHQREYLQPEEEVVAGRFRMRLVRRTQRPQSQTPRQKFALDILSAPGQPAGGRLLLEQVETTLGRDKGCDMVFNDATVSRRHAAIMLHNSRFWLRPLSTTNPTFVNGVQVLKNRALEHGDEIQLSRDSSVRFVDLHEEVF